MTDTLTGWMTAMFAVAALLLTVASFTRDETRKNSAIGCAVFVAAGFAFLVIGTFGGSGATETPGPAGTPLADEPPAAGESGSVTTTGAPVPDFTPAAEPPTLPGERRYTLDFGDNTVVDLDSGLAEKTGDGDSEYEVELDFGRFYTEKDDLWGGATVKFLATPDVSFSGCDRATRIQPGVSHLNRMERDDSICVSTNRGAWAAMRILDVKSSSSGLGAGDIRFEVRLFTQ